MSNDDKLIVNLAVLLGCVSMFSVFGDLFGMAYWGAGLGVFIALALAITRK
jgi:hypothetical protein